MPQNMRIYNEDFLKVELESSSIDLIVTSPPYNLGIDYGVRSDELPYKDYLEFNKKWLTKAYELLKDGGRICINVPIDVVVSPIRLRSGRPAGRASLLADITILAKRAGFKYKGTIVWNHSTSLMAGKQYDKKRYAMAFSKSLEVIIIFYIGEWKPVKKEFREWVNNIWQFSGESTKRVNHPAPFPVELPRRLIKMLSNEGDVVLDPFMGSGTTLVACKMLNRNGVGVEVNRKFCEVARKRLGEVVK